MFLLHADGLIEMAYYRSGPGFAGNGGLVEGWHTEN
jgi:hypothetical protein